MATGKAHSLHQPFLDFGVITRIDDDPASCKEKMDPQDPIIASLCELPDSPADEETHSRRAGRLDVEGGG
jgi:hypothetical protein